MKMNKHDLAALIAKSISDKVLLANKMSDGQLPDVMIEPPTDDDYTNFTN